MSVCVTTLIDEGTDIRTQICLIAQEEGYIGQVRSRSKIKCQGHQVKKRLKHVSSDNERNEMK